MKMECNNCRFITMDSLTNKGAAEKERAKYPKLAFCVRYPPQVYTSSFATSPGDYSTAIPAVRTDFWCGEWREKL